MFVVYAKEVMEAFRAAAEQQAQSAPPPLAGPQLGSCASSGHAWRLRAARHSQEEAGPPGAQPPPRLLERAASKAADSTAFDRSGGHVGHLHLHDSSLARAQVETQPDMAGQSRPSSWLAEAGRSPGRPGA